MDLQGQGGILQGDEDAEMNAVSKPVDVGAGYRIAGGTDEILRNIVSEQVLGLPQDIRVDKKVPFNELPGVAANKPLLALKTGRPPGRAGGLFVIWCVLKPLEARQNAPKRHERLASVLCRPDDGLDRPA